MTDTLTIKEAAAAAGTTFETVRKWMQSGKVTVAGRRGKALLLDASSVLAHIEAVDPNRWPTHASISCPHCTGQPGWRRLTCCVCSGLRVVAFSGELIASQGAHFRALLNAWARPGCACGACQMAGPVEAAIGESAARSRRLTRRPGHAA